MKLMRIVERARVNHIRGSVVAIKPKTGYIAVPVVDGTIWFTG
jgi:hypothetical protein